MKKRNHGFFVLFFFCVKNYRKFVKLHKLKKKYCCKIYSQQFWMATANLSCCCCSCSGNSYKKNVNKNSESHNFLFFKLFLIISSHRLQCFHYQFCTVHTYVQYSTQSNSFLTLKIQIRYILTFLCDPVFVKLSL